MKFWKNIFNKKEKQQAINSTTKPPTKKPSLGIPTLVNLIPSKLLAKIFYHTIKTQNGEEKCLAYLTEGLKDIGQKELLLVLRNNDHDYQVSERPLDFFRQVYQLASDGRIVDRSDVSQFGKNDLFGWKGIVYADVPDNIKTEIPADTLAMVLLSMQEVLSIQKSGYMRILSMLGKEKRFYPFPYWSDLNRINLPIEEVSSKSILYQINGTIRMHHATITTQNNKVSLKLPKDLASKYLPTEVLSNSLSIAILPSLDKNTDGCLTWTFDTSFTDAIVPNNSKGAQLGGCFLVLLPGQPHNSVRITEDGFTLMMSNNNWTKFWESMIHKRELLIPSTNNQMDFSLEWR